MQVVLGKDLIARLSMDTFHRLRDDMVTARCASLGPPPRPCRKLAPCSAQTCAALRLQCRCT